MGTASCSAPTYRTEVPLTDQTFESADGLLKGRVPEGWFVSTDGEIAPQLAAWLVRKDYGAALTFQEFRLDPGSARYVEREGLPSLADISFHFRQAEEPSATLVTKPSEFLAGGRSFCRYEYNSSRQGGLVSVAVFLSGGRFYESAAFTLKRLPSDEFGAIQNTQRAVLVSLQP